MSLTFSPLSYMNEEQKKYANGLKLEFESILNQYMKELCRLNYAHHVSGNDTYIIRRDKQFIFDTNKNRVVHAYIFYISKTNLYSRPQNKMLYRFANMAAYLISDCSNKTNDFIQHNNYYIKILYEV